ncbi:MAG: hypothetical protein IJW65_05980 [Clostridia bacterium]|nr:hypothetical protein [Clostridia bacterium]
MKRLKLLTVILLASILCLVSCSGRYNTSNSRRPYDSLNIPKSELKRIQNDYPDEAVVRIVSGDVLYAFDQESEASDAWNKPVSKQMYHYTWYMLVPEDESFRGALAKSDGYMSETDDRIGDELFLYAIHPEKVFDKDVKVKNTYCFLEGDFGFDNAPFIYYVTSDGDYVLYRSNSDDVTCLFTEEQFREFVHALLIEDGLYDRIAERSSEAMDPDNWLMGPGSGNMVFIHMTSEEVYDVSPYIFTENN